MKGPSLDGISERAAKFGNRCAQSKDGVVDLFVGGSPPASTRGFPQKLISSRDRSVRGPRPPVLQLG